MVSNPKNRYLTRKCVIQRGYVLSNAIDVLFNTEKIVSNAENVKTYSINYMNCSVVTWWQYDLCSAKIISYSTENLSSSAINVLSSDKRQCTLSITNVWCVFCSLIFFLLVLKVNIFIKKDPYTVNYSALYKVLRVMSIMSRWRRWGMPIFSLVQYIVWRLLICTNPSFISPYKCLFIKG